MLIALAVATAAIIAFRLRRPAASRGSESGGHVEWVDPKKILFSLPTIYDVQPVLDEVPGGVQPAFKIHEDDWRQVEFVARRHRAALEQELADLRAFKQAHSKGVGWDSISVRKERPDGLTPEHIPFQALL